MQVRFAHHCSGKKQTGFCAQRWTLLFASKDLLADR
jgi:hypothetical protein